MKRIPRVGLCVLLLLTVSYSTPTVRSAGGNPSQPDLDAAGSEIVATESENREPVCARPDGGIEPCATRYPKETREWRESVHGSAYLSGDTDAPGCTDCHDDPESSEIRTASFRLSIPSRCARCHDDETLMRKHEVATDVYVSYRSDFHGLTIDYYRHHDPSMWRYEAVCIDCHRSHAIYRASDSRSSIAPANLLGTCQQCHPEAEANFTSIATGHFRTDRETSLLAYCVALIYRILIPTVIGLMAAYVALDIFHRLRKRFAGTK
jgi:5-methylcytosine-specific restriction endonuclease McrA